MKTGTALMILCPNRRPVVTSIILLLLAILASPVKVHAATDDDYAAYLFRTGFYDEAFRRYLFLQYKAGETPKRNYYRYWMARSALEDGKPAQAESQLKEIFNAGNTPDIPAGDIFLQYLRSLYFQKKFYETAFEGESSTLYSSSPAIEEICAWSYINTGDWDKAAGIFNRLNTSPLPAEKPGMKKADRYREISEMLNERPGFNKKSPLTAGILSALFPGAGHAYAGNWDNAFGAFILNAVFGGLTAYSIYKKEWIYAGFFGFIEAGWYTGNIVSAGQEARYRNRAEENDFRFKLSVHFPFGLGNFNKK